MSGTFWKVSPASNLPLPFCLPVLLGREGSRAEDKDHRQPPCSSSRDGVLSSASPGRGRRGSPGPRSPWPAAVNLQPCVAQARALAAWAAGASVPASVARGRRPADPGERMVTVFLSGRCLNRALSLSSRCLCQRGCSGTFSASSGPVSRQSFGTWQARCCGRLRSKVATANHGAPVLLPLASRERALGEGPSLCAPSLHAGHALTGQRRAGLWPPRSPSCRLACGVPASQHGRGGRHIPSEAGRHNPSEAGPHALPQDGLLVREAATLPLPVGGQCPRLRHVWPLC